MALSPLKFARRFEAFKAELRTIGELDNALMYVVAFWPELRVQLEQPGSGTYLDEYLPELFSRLTDSALPDLTIEELESISRVLDELPGSPSLRASPSTSSRGDRRQAADPAISASREQTGAPSVDAARRLVLNALARLRACAGDTQGAVHAASEAAGEEVELPDSIDFGGLDESGRLALIAERHLHDFPSTRRAIISLHDRLNDARDELHDNRVWCLFVEKNGDRSSGRSRMCRLTGVVRQESGVAVSKDTVAFDNQIVARNDPFVGVAYQALEAVRRVATHHKLVSRPERPLRADFKVIDSKQHFTGDSTGLGAALVSYTQLMKVDVRRHEQMISGEVAVTGAIDAGGRIAPVNETTLAAKVRRAFFSHVRYLVVPQANLAAAQSALDSLEIDYPHRRLRLIGVDFLDEIIDNHNVIRPQRVCPIDYVSRRARRVTRSTWVQVPLLAALLWVLLALVWPKYFDPWFDWHISDIEVVGNRFRTLNADGQTLWWSPEYASDLNADMFAKGHDVRYRRYVVLDIDGDERDELIFAPNDVSLRNHLQCYASASRLSSKGRVVWQVSAFDKEAGTSTRSAIYTILPIECDSSCYIMTFACGSPPPQQQVMTFDTEGNRVSGPLLHPGDVTNRPQAFLDPDTKEPRVAVGCINNRLNCATLMVLDPFELRGETPTAPERWRSAEPGSQVAFVAFPETPISIGPAARNAVQGVDIIDGGDKLDVVVTEGMNLEVDGYSYTNLDENAPPAITYRLNRDIIPTGAYIADSEVPLWRLFFQHVLNYTDSTWPFTIDSLLDEIMVFHGDSLVHHRAAGKVFTAGMQ